MKSKSMDRYELYIWLCHEYDDKLVRHQVIENLYNKIYDKIIESGLELKITEDELYHKLLRFIISQTQLINA